ncbi:hypothetical protein L1987_34882 [Smallanthus sonchifolius]|uniref:Uncharacterized protein n=1 Tax=Smallanthus sonchifolius TaxID=185202 RepID=A0ACB9HUB9_9ASTR|nr:hypothetical protein L1987_34882 [Smallanthus sonchifolius]
MKILLDEKNDENGVSTFTCGFSLRKMELLFSMLQKEEARITAWENLQGAKAEALIRKLEMKLEKKKSASMDKILSKHRAAQIKAQELRRNMSEDVSPRNSHKFRSLHRHIIAKPAFMHLIKNTRAIQFDSLSDFTKTEISRKESVLSDSTNSLITMKNITLEPGKQRISAITNHDPAGNKYYVTSKNEHNESLPNQTEELMKDVPSSNVTTEQTKTAKTTYPSHGYMMHKYNYMQCKIRDLISAI